MLPSSLALFVAIMTSFLAVNSRHFIGHWTLVPLLLLSIWSKQGFWWKRWPHLSTAISPWKCRKQTTQVSDADSFPLLVFWFWRYLSVPIARLNSPRCMACLASWSLYWLNRSIGCTIAFNCSSVNNVKFSSSDDKRKLCLHDTNSSKPFKRSKCTRHILLAPIFSRSSASSTSKKYFALSATCEVCVEFSSAIPVGDRIEANIAVRTVIVTESGFKSCRIAAIPQWRQIFPVWFQSALHNLHWLFSWSSRGSGFDERLWIWLMQERCSPLPHLNRVLRTWTKPLSAVVAGNISCLLPRPSQRIFERRILRAVFSPVRLVKSGNFIVSSAL